jgi:hypothetical protein
MNDICFMHIQNKLYGTSITGQVLWDVLILPKGLNPSQVKPSRTFLLSDEKNLDINDQMTSMLHCQPDALIVNTPSFVQPSVCQFI